MSGPVVAIALIPSIIGMLLGALLAVGTGMVGSKATPALESFARNQLESNSVPATVISNVVSGKQPTEAEMAQLTPEQQTAVRAMSSTDRKSVV